MKTKQPLLGIGLRAHRRRCRLTIEQAAERAGLRKGHLFQIEAGRDVQLSTLNKILKAYGFHLILLTGR